jgi:hypothetical protein
MEVAFRLYFSRCGLGDVTQTRRLHGVSKQQGRGSGHLMWYAPYAAEHDSYVCALPCRIQCQEHGHPYHGKVAMPATLFHETPASPCGRTWKVDFRKDFIRL